MTDIDLACCGERWGGVYDIFVKKNLSFIMSEANRHEGSSAWDTRPTRTQGDIDAAKKSYLAAMGKKTEAWKIFDMARAGRNLPFEEQKKCLSI